MRKIIGLLAAVMLMLGLSAPVSAGQWREDYVSISGPTHVLRVGKNNARQVLVLAAGQFGAAGDLRPLARTLAAQLPDTQVWAVDRRETSLADLSGFANGNPDDAAAYYLGGHYTSRSEASVPQMAGWGLAVAMNDLRAVVRAASDGGRRQVVLGGHSWGATTALAYAAWDFGGHAGYRDISGLVLIDGGMHDAFAGEGDIYRVTPAQAVAQSTKINGGAVFDPSLTMGRAETFAIFVQLAGLYARTAPNQPSTLADILPDGLRPPGPVTNLGLLNFLFVQQPLSPDFAVNTSYTSLSTVAATLAGPTPAALEWYWPARLTLDLQAADPYARTPTATVLGLRLWHARQVNVPFYSFQTGLTKGSVNTAAQWVVAHSRIRSATYAGDNAMTHLDPLWADPSRNTMLRTVVPFLREINER